MGAMTRSRLVAVLALLLVALGISLGACGGDSAGTPATPTPAAAETEPPAASPTPTPAAAPSPAARGTPGCGRALPADLKPGETTSRVLQSANRTRTYLVYTPPAAGPASAPMALVLNFHGLGSTGAQQHVYGGWVPIAQREGFVVVSPNGVDNSWLIAAGLDDLQFVRDLVAALGNELCLDPARVYATGMSNGGFMSTTLACRASDLIAAIAPVAGQSPPGPGCSDRPVPIISFHGTADGVVPYEAGTINAGAVSGSPFPGVPAVQAEWAKHNGCDGSAPAETKVADDVTKVEYRGCAAPVVHYRVEGGGHTWPGAPAVPRLGPTATSISASELAWAFFQAHPMR